MLVHALLVSMAADSAVDALAPSQTTENPKSSQSTSAPSNDYRIEIISPPDLLNPSQQSLRSELNNLINDVYVVHGHPRSYGGNGTMYTELRINSDDQLVHELGPEGLLAICFDESLPEAPPQRQVQPVFGEPYQPGKYGKVVATASLKPWKGKTVDLFRRAQLALVKESPALDVVSETPLSDLELSQVTNKIQVTDNEYQTSWDWEVSLCASVNDPKYRGQGLMIRCLDALVAKLVAHRNTLVGTKDPRGGLQVKLWSTALDGSGNTEYWMKRGFVKEGELDVAPKGLWSATRVFKIQTLSMIVG